MNTRTARIGAVASLVGLAAFAASPAEALNRIREWPRGDVANIVVKEDGVVQGRAHGTWRVTDTTDGTRSRANAEIQDRKPGGNSIYVQLNTQSHSGYCFIPEGTSCDKTFYDHASDQTSRTNSDLWVSLVASTDVDYDDDWARGALKVCEDQRWSPDPCSGYTYTNADNY